MTTGTITKPRCRAARAAIGAAALALLVLATLHVLRPDLDPSGHMISEYGVGAEGWVMSVCFALFAAASASLIVALLPHAQTLMGRFGLAFLLAAAVGPAMGALFAMDPVSTPPAMASSSGRMHGVSFMIGVPGQLLAALLLSLTLRKKAAWAALPLLSFTVLTWLSLGAMAACIMAAAEQDSMVGAGVGLANRGFMVLYSIWLMLAAWPVAREKPR